MRAARPRTGASPAVAGAAGGPPGNGRRASQIRASATDPAACPVILTAGPNGQLAAHRPRAGADLHQSRTAGAITRWGSCRTMNPASGQRTSPPAPHQARGRQRLLPAQSLKTRLLHREPHQVAVPVDGHRPPLRRDRRRRTPDAAWYYPHPSPLTHRIKNHVAFWNGVTIEGTREKKPLTRSRPFAFLIFPRIVLGTARPPRAHTPARPS
ncbi:DUF427 domain-containing protein [Streptomyces sp. NPDC003032]